MAIINYAMSDATALPSTFTYASGISNPVFGNWGDAFGVQTPDNPSSSSVWNWSDLNNVNDCEIYLSYQTMYDTQGVDFFLRGGNVKFSTTRLDFYTANVVVKNGSNTTLLTVTSGTIPANCYTKVRIRLQGTTAYIKIWADAEVEPTSWTNTCTIPSATGTAQIGFRHTQSIATYIKTLAIATGSGETVEEKFYTDFENYSTGSLPSTFAKGGNTGSSATVTTYSTYGKVLSLYSPSNALDTYVYCKELARHTDVEIYAKLVNTVAAATAVGVGWTPNTGYEALNVNITATYLQAVEVDSSDSGTGIGSQYNVATATTQPYCMRVRYHGDTIYAKYWAASGSEPGSWQITERLSTTGMDFTHSGYAGIASWLNSGTVYVLEMGIATFGATAPTAAVGGGATNHAAQATLTVTTPTVSATGKLTAAGAGSVTTTISAITGLVYKIQSANIALTVATPTLSGTLSNVSTVHAGQGSITVATPTITGNVYKQQPGAASLVVATPTVSGTLITVGSAINHQASGTLTITPTIGSATVKWTGGGASSLVVTIPTISGTAVWIQGCAGSMTIAPTVSGTVYKTQPGAASLTVTPSFSVIPVVNYAGAGSVPAQPITVTGTASTQAAIQISGSVSSAYTITSTARAIRGGAGSFTVTVNATLTAVVRQQVAGLLVVATVAVVGNTKATFRASAWSAVVVRPLIDNRPQTKGINIGGDSNLVTEKIATVPNPTMDRQLDELVQTYNRNIVQVSETAAAAVPKGSTIADINATTGEKIVGARVQLTSGTDIASSFKLDGSLNMNKIRQYILVSGEENADDAMKASGAMIRKSFAVPTGATIISARLWAKGLRFFSLVTSTTNSTGAHTHSTNLSHSHNIGLGGYSTDLYGGTHGSDSQGAHSHALTYQTQFGTTPTTCYIGWNGIGSGWMGGPVNAPDTTSTFWIVQDYDMTGKFNNGGVSELWFDTYRLGRIQYNLLICFDVAI